MRRRYRPQPRNKPQHRINRYIRASEVRLIDQNGEQLGVVPIKEALLRAEEAELDLVEVAPNAKPPVCKIEDYRKVLYEKKKRDRTAKKKHKTVELKEIKIRPSIGQNDFDIKLNRGIKFLGNGNKVKVTMMFRGREIPTADKRGEMLRVRVLEALKDCGEQESYSRQSARQIIMIIQPKKVDPSAKKAEKPRRPAPPKDPAAKDAPLLSPEELEGLEESAEFAAEEDDGDDFDDTDDTDSPDDDDDDDDDDDEKN